MLGLEIVLIAISLSMDSFAFAVSSGIVLRKFFLKDALRLALYMGIFQALMPCLGWFLGDKLQYLIVNFDHWVAFVLLFGLGAKMIYDDFSSNSDKILDPRKHRVLALMGIATSIDALVIGLNLALLGVEIAIPSLVIGVVCFTASIFGVYLGARLGTKLRFKTQWIGGLILIGLGVKILIEHLYIS